ncbi:hypothetical protein DXG01_007773, partial [Tephrocybe rancida]
MSTQSIRDSLVSRAKAVNQALLPRATFTVPGATFTIPDPTFTDPDITVTILDPTFTIPNPTFTIPDPTFTIPDPTFTVLDPTSPDNGGGKKGSRPGLSRRTSTTTAVPSVIIPSVLPPHRTTLSVSMVTNSDSHTPASADNNTIINTPMSSSKFPTFDTSISQSAPTDSSGGVTVGSAKPKVVPIGVIAGASATAAVVILVALGLFCIRHRSRKKKPVEGIVTMEQINDGSTILYSRCDHDTHHKGPNISEMSPSLDAPHPWHRQRGDHPQTEAQPPLDNDAHILSPVSIHKPSVSQAENIQCIDKQLVQMSEDIPVMAGTVFQQFYRELVMLRREIDELRRSEADVPPEYPGSM